MPLSQTRSDQRMNCKTFRFIYYDANEFCKLWPSSHVRNSWDQQQELCDECEQQGQARKLTFVLNLKCIFNHFQVPQRKCTRLFTTIILTEECIWEVTCFCFANWDVCNIDVKWSTKNTALSGWFTDSTMKDCEMKFSNQSVPQKLFC